MKKSILTAASMLATILAMAQGGQPAQTQMPENVAYFEYNRTFVVENFNDEPVEINIVGDPEDVKMLRSLLDDETVYASYLLRNSSGGISSFNFPASQRQKQRYFFL